MKEKGGGENDEETRMELTSLRWRQWRAVYVLFKIKCKANEKFESSLNLRKRLWALWRVLRWTSFWIDEKEIEKWLPSLQSSLFDITYGRVILARWHNVAVKGLSLRNIMLVSIVINGPVSDDRSLKVFSSSETAHLGFWKKKIFRKSVRRLDTWGEGIVKQFKFVKGYQAISFTIFLVHLSSYWRAQGVTTYSLKIFQPQQNFHHKVCTLTRKSIVIYVWLNRLKTWRKVKKRKAAAKIHGCIVWPYHPVLSTTTRNEKLLADHTDFSELEF